MQMQVEDRLPRTRAHVKHRTIAVLDVALASNLRGYKLAVADDLSVLRSGLFKVDNVALRNDEHMRWRLRINVFKGVNLLVLVHSLRWNLAGNDFAEQAVV